MYSYCQVLVTILVGILVAISVIRVPVDEVKSIKWPFALATWQATSEFDRGALILPKHAATHN